MLGVGVTSSLGVDVASGPAPPPQHETGQQRLASIDLVVVIGVSDILLDQHHRFAIDDWATLDVDRLRVAVLVGYPEHGVGAAGGKITAQLIAILVSGSAIKGIAVRRVLEEFDVGVDARLGGAGIGLAEDQDVAGAVRKTDVVVAVFLALIGNRPGVVEGEGIAKVRAFIPSAASRWSFVSRCWCLVSPRPRRSPSGVLPSGHRCCRCQATAKPQRVSPWNPR